MKHVDEGIYPLRRRTWRWYLGWATIFLPVSAAAAYFIWLRVEGRAIDAELAALRKAGQPTNFQELRTSPIADTENAALLLREAARLIDYNGAAWTAYNRLPVHHSPYTTSWPMTEEERRITRQAVIDNQASLRLVEQSRTRPKFDWQLQLPVSDWRVIASGLNQQRTLVMLLEAAARDAHDRGDEMQAIAYLRDTRHIARGVAEQPGLVPWLISMGLESLADSTLCDMLPDLLISPSQTGAGVALPPREAASLIAELLDDEPSYTRMRWAHRSEMVFMIDMLKSIDERGAAALRGANQPSPTVGESLSSILNRPWYRCEARLSLHFTNDTHTIAGKSANLNDYRSAVDPQVAELLRPGRWHPLVAIYIPSEYRSVAQYFQSVTRRRMTATALAIRWYAIDHDGQLPESLTDLTPNYLPKIPLDALANGGPIRYAADNNRPRLYSVGENGVDDGGSDEAGFMPDGPIPGGKPQKDILIDLARQARTPGEAEKDAASGGVR